MLVISEPNLCECDYAVGIHRYERTDACRPSPIRRPSPIFSSRTTLQAPGRRRSGDNESRPADQFRVMKASEFAIAYQKTLARPDIKGPDIKGFRAMVCQPELE